MMDWIAGAYGSIKAATDITQSMLSLKVDAAVTTKVVELNGVLLGLQAQLNTAHAEHSALISRIGELEAEIAQFKRWEEERKRYALHQTEAGGWVYGLKPGMENGEVPHYLCPQCFEDRIKSPLQPSDSRTHQTLVCHRCSAEIRLAPGGMRISPAALEMARRKT